MVKLFGSGSATLGLQIYFGISELGFRVSGAFLEALMGDPGGEPFGDRSLFTIAVIGPSVVLPVIVIAVRG